MSVIKILLPCPRPVTVYYLLLLHRHRQSSIWAFLLLHKGVSVFKRNNLKTACCVFGNVQYFPLTFRSLERTNKQSKHKKQRDKENQHVTMNINLNCSLAIRECIGLPYLALGLVLKVYLFFSLQSISSVPHINQWRLGHLHFPVRQGVCLSLHWVLLVPCCIHFCCELALW